MNAREGCGNERKGKGKFGEEKKSGPCMPTVGININININIRVDGPKKQTNKAAK
jgi:hypothetical protein